MERLSQRVKVPRFARTVEIVIHLPELAQTKPTHAPPPKPTRSSRIIALGKAFGGVIVAITSVAAIIVASMALSEQKSADRTQQQVNETQAVSNQRQQVSQVTYVQEGDGVPNVPVIIENLGTSPAYSPILIFQFEGWIHSDIQRKAENYPVVGTFSVVLNNMPACSSSTINLGPTVVRDVKFDKSVWPPEVPLSLAELRSPTLGTSVTGMIFSDGSGRAWQYTAGNGLDAVASAQIAEKNEGVQVSSSGYLNATYKSTSGCT